MKNLIFSIYKPVDVDRKFVDKQTNTIKQFEKYFDKLISNKEEYAKLINAEFKLVTPEKYAANPNIYAPLPPTQMFETAEQKEIGKVAGGEFKQIAEAANTALSNNQNLLSIN